MNLALEKGERVTTGGKGRDEIRSEVGMVANVPTMDSLRRRWMEDGNWKNGGGIAGG